ncbi:MAG TPA: hypothetical protein VHL09_12125 [Dehalococcoidia bacterium]|nr:hypothetical protein [Dehalococcoidia bacterium]
MRHDKSGDPVIQKVRHEAKEVIGNRLAFVSAAIWVGGVTGLYLLVFLPQNMGTGQATLFALGLLVPAAAPWLAYRRLVAAEIERRTVTLRGRREAGESRSNPTTS